MKIFWFSFKLAVIVGISFYLMKMDGYLNITWAGYYIDMSTTVFCILLILLGYISWILARFFSFSKYAPKAYWLNRKSIKHQNSLSNVLDAETAFYNKNNIALHKIIMQSKQVLGENHNAIIIMRIQEYILEKDYSMALFLYNKSIRTAIADKAGHLLHETGDADTVAAVLKIQSNNDVLQGWAYLNLAETCPNYDKAIAFIDLGVKNGVIHPDVALVQKTLHAVRFKQKGAMLDTVKVWVKTYDKSLLKSFETFASFAVLRDLKVAEKILKKDPNPYSQLALAHMCCGVGIWGLSRQYLNLAKNKIEGLEYYKALLTIEKAEKGETEEYINILKNIESAL